MIVPPAIMPQSSKVGTPIAALQATMAAVAIPKGAAMFSKTMGVAVEGIFYSDSSALLQVLSGHL